MVNQKKLGAIAEYTQRVKEQSQEVVHVVLPEVNYSSVNKNIESNLIRTLDMMCQTASIQASREQATYQANPQLVKSLKQLAETYVQMRTEQRAGLEAMSDAELQQALDDHYGVTQVEDKECLTPPAPGAPDAAPAPLVHTNFLPKTKSKDLNLHSPTSDSDEEEEEMPKPKPRAPAPKPKKKQAQPVMGKKSLGPPKKVSVDFNKLEQEKGNK